MKLNRFQPLSDVLPVLTILGSLVILIWISTYTLYFRLDTDYNVAIPMAEFAIRAIRDPSNFLVWNPFIGLGIPVLGDPSSLVFSPWFMPWFLLFGPENGLRVIISLSVICSGVSMWMLLRFFSLSTHISQWGGVLYGTSGAIAAMVASGHIEKLPTYALAPLVFMILLGPGSTFANSALLGLIYATLFFSVDFYGVWFFSLFWLAFRLYDLFTKKRGVGELGKEAVSIYGMFLVFAMPKLIPFVRDVLPHFNRLSYINPFEGSLHAIFLPLSYIIPWQVMFYDRPTLQRIVGFHYNWYEYYAFITPMALIPLYFWRPVLKNRVVIYCLISIALGALYLALAYPYSPFHWIFQSMSFARTFRVPQRIVVPLLVPLMLLIALCLEYMIRRFPAWRTRILIGICAASCVWTYGMSFLTMKTAFAPNRSTEESVATDLRAADSGKFYVVNLSCCMQPYLMKASIPVLNYYYGWSPVGVPTYKNTAGDAYDFSVFTYMRPTYIIAPSATDMSAYGYSVFLDRGTIRVWKTDSPTIFPSI